MSSDLLSKQCMLHREKSGPALSFSLHPTINIQRFSYLWNVIFLREIDELKNAIVAKLMLEIILIHFLHILTSLTYAF